MKLPDELATPLRCALDDLLSLDTQMDGVFNDADTCLEVADWLDDIETRARNLARHCRYTKAPFPFSPQKPPEGA